MSTLIRKREGFPGQHLIVLPPSLKAQARMHPLLQRLFVTDVGFYPEASGHYVDRGMGLTGFILIGCLSGRGWLRIEEGETFDVHTGEVALVPPGLAHAYGANEQTPWSIMWAHFEGSDLPYYQRLLSPTGSEPVLRLPPGVLEQLGFFELYQRLELGCTLLNLLSTSLRLSWMLGELVVSRCPTGEQARTTQEALAQNIEWMRIHRHERLGLDELAKQLSLSIPHYSSLFKKKTGSSPMHYFHHLKIQYACELLALTDLSIAEVAKAIGLEDAFYFSRLFKKVMGISPRFFRENRKD